MKKVTTINYVADDGKSFSNKEKCLKYEVILSKVRLLLSDFPFIDDMSFSNGDGFIQHDEKAVLALQKGIVRLANEYFEPTEPYTHFNYYLGRIIDDSNTSCLNKLSYKIMCIDSQNREWGQPYYANNPDKGVQKQLN